MPFEIASLWSLEFSLTALEGNCIQFQVSIYQVDWHYIDSGFIYWHVCTQIHDHYNAELTLSACLHLLKGLSMAAWLRPLSLKTQYYSSYIKHPHTQKLHISHVQFQEKNFRACGIKQQMWVLLPPKLELRKTAKIAVPEKEPPGILDGKKHLGKCQSKERHVLCRF